MKKQLKITLKSDLCAAVGKHYAAMIDLDTAIDEYGLPYIPSRRIKGCLKEIAEMFLSNTVIGELFGETGSDKSGSLHIDDAYIEDYADIIKEISSKSVTHEKVTELFCSVRGETAIENDTAKENSLRYIRVVNMEHSFTGKPLEFFADIEFDDKDCETVKKCVKALRNIGYQRNRGLGVIECDIVESISDSFCPDKTACQEIEDLRITIQLESDLMLPGSNSTHTDDYITGTMLLGAVAGKYMKANDGNDSGFNDIFFSDVKFGNLYPAVLNYQDGKAKFDYTVPAPRYFAKIKAAKESEEGIHNIIDNNEDKQFKVLKNGYISKDFGHITPETKIVYHNSNIHSENEDEKGLYMQYCLTAGQYFSGVISGTKDKISQIVELFYEDNVFNDVLRFGRSKTAQYSRCRICEFKKAETENKELSATDCIAAYRLESDVILINENGIISTDIFDLCKVLNVNPKSLRKETAIATKTISGYNAKWNMKKPQFPVISAGSVIVFYMKQGEQLTKEIRYIGEKQNEGYGKVKLIINAKNDSVKSEKPNKNAGSINIKSSVVEMIEKNDALETAAKLGVEYAENIKLEAAQVGRITLMLKDADKSQTDKLENFQRRINSIKNPKTKKEALKHFKTETLEKVLENTDWDYVYKYIMTALTVRKYQLRKENKKNV